MAKLSFKEFGSGKPMIILHGLFGSSDNWFTIGKKLSETYHVFLPDLRNHGDSIHSDEFNYEVMANDLLEFIEDHVIKNPDIIGHSMGGKVAMRFALDHPNLFSKLVVVDIAPKAYRSRHDKLLEYMSALDLTHVKNRQDADRLLKESVSGMAERQFLLKNIKRHEQGYQWKINLRAIGENMERITEEISSDGKVEKPALFIRGGKSDYILPEDYPAIHALFTNAKVIEIAKAGHWIHADQPEDFQQALVGFLGD